MKKVLRFIFSGTFFIFLMLLIELAAVIFLQFFLDDVMKATGLMDFEKNGSAALWSALVYVFIKGVAFIVGLFIFFKIVNKEEDPEFKIPWIVGMLLLPFFTSVVYLIFGNHGLRKKDKVIISATRNAYNAHFVIKDEEKEEYQKDLGNAVGAFNYLHNTTMLRGHKNNRVTYYKTGEEFFPAFIEGIKQAKEFIFIEFFIITDGKMWSEVQEVLKQKAQEGVDVRIVYDDMGCGGTISYFTPHQLAKYGIKAYKFHPFRPLLSGVFNNRDHRKIVIVDGNTKQWTDENGIVYIGVIPFLLEESKLGF